MPENPNDIEAVIKKTLIAAGAIAELAAVYYQALLNKGMSNEAAMYLTGEFQKAIVSSSMGGAGK